MEHHVEVLDGTGPKSSVDDAGEAGLAEYPAGVNVVETDEGDGRLVRVRVAVGHRVEVRSNARSTIRVVKPGLEGSGHDPGLALPTSFALSSSCVAVLPLTMMSKSTRPSCTSLGIRVGQHAESPRVCLAEVAEPEQPKGRREVA